MRVTPTVSIQISRREQELSFPLFDRSKRAAEADAREQAVQYRSRQSDVVMVDKLGPLDS